VTFILLMVPFMEKLPIRPFAKKLQTEISVPPDV
jgi:hypothetical protein